MSDNPSHVDFPQENKETTSEFGQELRELRERHKLSQGDLGDLLGIGALTVLRWEKGAPRGGPVIAETILSVIKTATHEEVKRALLAHREYGPWASTLVLLHLHEKKVFVPTWRIPVPGAEVVSRMNSQKSKVVRGKKQSAHIVRHKHDKDLQRMVFAAMHNALLGRKVPLPVDVRFVRHYPPGNKPMDPSDNLPGAFKPVQDEVAKFLRVNDGDADKIRFSYDQQRASGALIEILIFPRAPWL